MGSSLSSSKAVDQELLPAKKTPRKSRMVLIHGHLRKTAADGAEEAERRIEVWVEAKPGATVGWVMSRVVEELASREPDVPSIVGLRVVRAAESFAEDRGAAPRPQGEAQSGGGPCPCCIGSTRNGQGGQHVGALRTEVEEVGMEQLLVDYGQALEDALAEGDTLECVFEVEAAALGSRQMSDSPNEPRIGVGDFQIVRVLGTGASCRVVQVRHKRDGKQYAVKVMSKRKIVTNGKKLERAIAEKRLLARLSHPFVVSLHWAFQTRSHLFMVLDYCAGGELFYHLQRRGRFEEPDTRFYISEILLGLEYLHTQGVLYRDLKPENCLLDAEGHLKLTDFGLSKENLTQSALFQSFVGTVLYLSPEMIRREGHGIALDFYCLGCLLYVLLTGTLPHFSGDVNQMVARRAKNESYQAPRRGSPEAVDLCDKLLEADPVKRLGTQRQAIEVKEHPWFRDVDFFKLYRRERQPVFPNFPPIDISSCKEQCFSSEFTRLAVTSQLATFGSHARAQEQTIAGFSKVDEYH